jgi:hypothetical protein
MDEAAGLKKSKGASTSSTTNTPLLLRTTPRSKEWPEDFVCPISRCLMADPVVVATGQSYERMCIQLWFQRGYRHCFKSGMAVMTPIVLTPNLQLRSAIVVWCDQHQVPRPRVPSLELATELLERSLSRVAAAAMRDNGFNSPSATVGFAKNIKEQLDVPRPEGGLFLDDDDGSSRSDFFASSGNMWSASSSGTWSRSWNAVSHADGRLTNEEGQQQRSQDHQAGPPASSRRRNWSLQSPGSTTEYDLSPPRQILSSRKTATDELLAKSQDQSDQRSQQSPESVLEYNEGSGVQPSREYARVHPQSQDQEQSRGLTMWNPSRISHASSESDQWVPQSHQSPNLTAEYVSSSGACEEYVREQPCFESSGCSGAKSIEWCDSPAMKGSRYVHSATGRSLTEEIQTAAELGIHGIPLPLATKPSSYHSDESGLDQALVGMEAEILHKLQHKKLVEQEKGAAEIRSLTRTSEDYRLTLCTSAILGALLPLLQSKHARLQSDATAALMNLTLPQENKVKVARAGAIPYFIEVLKSKTEDAQVHAAGALFSLALNDDNKAPIGVLQAIPPLLHLLKSGPLEAQRDAAMALYQLSFLKMNRGKILQAGAVALLMDLAGGESSAVASRVLLILNNLASGPEGRNAICEANGITELVHILAHRSLAPPLDPGMQQ